MEYRLESATEDRSRFAETIYHWGAESADTSDAAGVSGELTDEMLADYRESQLEHDEFDNPEFAAQLFDENFRKGWEEERGR